MPRLRTFGPYLAISLAFGVAPLGAQMHHVDKPQRITRAVGVYEWTGDITKPDAARLIPVSLFINGHYEDAGVYMAQPVPFALETGDVYAIQKAGQPLGTLDVDFARNIVDRRSAADDNPLGAWYGYGHFLALEAEAKPPALHPSAQISQIVSSSGSADDDRPHFVNRTPAAESGSTKTGAIANTPAPPDDPDRPHMTRKGDTDTSASNAPSSPGTGDVDTDPERPTLGRRDAKEEKKEEKRAKKESGSGVEPMRTSLNDDPDRPALHRGKIESATAPPQLTGVPPNLHQAVAVSDAVTRDTHVFTRDWESPDERTETLAAMQKLAQPIAAEYIAANHLQTASEPHLKTAPAKAPSATHSSSARRPVRSARLAPPAAAPAPSFNFADEQLQGFTLSYGGLPTFVYSAAVQTADNKPVRVTVIAQRLPSGELQTSLSSVTDEAHLDRVPWMRLVDAVDPDASHRASLLFELRARSSRQFALYSLTSAHAQQTFVTGIIE